LLIYTQHITPRLEYTLHLVFALHYGLPYKLTTDKEAFAAANEPKLCYAAEGFPRIVPQALLFEDGVTEQDIQTVLYKQLLCPFAAPGDLLPFDVLSAIFYVVTRYEEYLPHEKNKYGQFKAAGSLNVRCGWLHLPVVDIWLQQLQQQLLVHYPALRCQQKTFSASVTYDIDTAYAFRGRSASIQAALMARDILKGRFATAAQRISVLRKKKTDPYDTYQHIITNSEQHRLPLCFFFLLGDKNQYNRNLPHQSPILHQLIQQLRQSGTVGIHPSYYADADAEMLLAEKQRLETITGSSVMHSRQHYLRLQWPQTYQNLIKSGITNDYSMGFAETPGFRAGTCTPFYFFDLQRNEATPLLIHPFAFMEGSFAEDMALTPEQALPKMQQLLQAVKEVNGHFSCIWHNHTLSSQGFWKGWRAVHDTICKLAASK
jgi:hypothetical protein